MSLEHKNDDWRAIETPGLREMLKDKLMRLAQEGKIEESLDVMDVIDVLDVWDLRRKYYDNDASRID